DLKVGISWRGGTDRTRKGARSIPLDMWRPLLELEGVRFISLQYGEVKADIERANASLAQPIVHFETAEIGNFDHLAGLVSALDLVISVQTAIVHLSGAIGKPCWVMVPFAAEWRYGAAGDSMPWYSSVKLFRQEMRGDWDGPLTRVASELVAVVGGNRQTAPE